MIKEVSVRCKVYLGNYESIEVSVIGDGDEKEIISKLTTILSTVGKDHPATKSLAEAYINRVFGNDSVGDTKPLPETTGGEINDMSVVQSNQSEKDQNAYADANRYVKMSGKQCMLCGREVTVHEAETSSLFISGGRVKCVKCMNLKK